VVIGDPSAGLRAGPSAQLRASWQGKNLKIYGEKSKMSARRHFWVGVYPPVFAYVGEIKELRAENLYVGETKDLEGKRFGARKRGGWIDRRARANPSAKLRAGPSVPVKHAGRKDRAMLRADW
jgi:hypothetical protein